MGDKSGKARYYKLTKEKFTCNKVTISQCRTWIMELYSMYAENHEGVTGAMYIIIHPDDWFPKICNKDPDFDFVVTEQHNNLIESIYDIGGISSKKHVVLMVGDYKTDEVNDDDRNIRTPKFSIFAASELFTNKALEIKKNMETAPGPTLISLKLTKTDSNEKFFNMLDTVFHLNGFRPFSYIEEINDYENNESDTVLTRRHGADQNYLIPLHSVFTNAVFKNRKIYSNKDKQIFKVVRDFHEDVITFSCYI